MGYLIAIGGEQLLGKLMVPSLFITLALVVMLAGWLISYYEYHGIGPQDGITREGPYENLVSLTFDDGPSPIYTPLILDVLREKGVKATFFVVGQNVEKYPQVARRIVAEGHDIGNHTYSHRRLISTTENAVLEQLRGTDMAIQAATGIKTRLLRPPRGLFANATRRLVVADGYRIVLWTVSSLDWSGVSPRIMLRCIKRYTKKGGIILFHDSGALIRNEGGSRANTVSALPMIIDYLQGVKGFKIVPVSEMLERLEENASAQTDEALEKA